MENFDINKEYRVGAKLSFNGIALTVVPSINCNKCFFKGKCVDSEGYYPICCKEQRDDLKNIIFVESKNESNG